MNNFLHISLLLLAFAAGWFLRDMYSPDNSVPVPSVSEEPAYEHLDGGLNPEASTFDSTYEPGTEKLFSYISEGDFSSAHKLLITDSMSLSDQQVELFARMLVEQSIGAGLDSYWQSLNLRTLVEELWRIAPFAPASQFFEIVELSESEPLIVLPRFDELQSYYQEQVSHAQLEYLETWLIAKIENDLMSAQNWQSLSAWYQQLLSRSSDPVNIYRQMAQKYASLGKVIESNRAFDQLRSYGVLAPKDEALLNENTQSIAKSSLASVQLQRSGGGFIAPVIINGALSVEMLLDTGASISGLDTGFIERYALEKTGESILLATANGQVRSSIVNLQSIGFLQSDGVSTSTLSSLRVATLELGDRYQGLLGMDVLGQFEFYIHQGSAVLYLSPKGADAEAMFLN